MPDKLTTTEESDALHRRAGRADKKCALLAALLKHRVPYEFVFNLTPEEWAKVAKVAGVKPPSAETIEELRTLVSFIPEPVTITDEA